MLWLLELPEQLQEKTTWLLWLHGWHDWYLSTFKQQIRKNLDTHLIKGLKIKVSKEFKKTAFPFIYGDIGGINKLVRDKNIGIIKMEVCRNTKPISLLKHVRKITQ